MRLPRLHTLMAALAASGVLGAFAQQQHITLFEHDDFGGRSFSASGPIPDLQRTGFNDVASSVIVRHGNWELCSDAQFRGSCVTLAPGRYPSLRKVGLNDAVSSIRDLSAPGAGPGGNWGSGARVMLYSEPNFHGRSFVLNTAIVPNLESSGFNDRASSVRIESGYWLFCTDAQFMGECRTLGPGEHAQLPRGIDNRVSSIRRISEHYPYGGPANWR